MHDILGQFRCLKDCLIQFKRMKLVFRYLKEEPRVGWFTVVLHRTFRESVSSVDRNICLTGILQSNQISQAQLIFYVNLEDINFLFENQVREAWKNIPVIFAMGQRVTSVSVLRETCQTIGRAQPIDKVKLFLRRTGASHSSALDKIHFQRLLIT